MNADLDAVTRLLDQSRYEEAADLAIDVDDVNALADILVAAHGRAEFLEVDVALGRMLQDVLDRLPENEGVRRSRVAAKIAFELRGDPATLAERRALLDLAGREAARAGDPRAESEALLTAVLALWEPEGVSDRLSAAERVIALARRTRDVDIELEARLTRMHALIELWRVWEAELELAAYARLAKPLDRADLKVFVASRRAVLGLISGRYDEALRQAEIADRNAVLAGMPDVERLRMTTRAQVDRERGEGFEVRLEGLEMLRDLATRMPGHYFETDVARLLLALGRSAEARTELARALPALLTSSGYRWLFASVQAAEVAVEVGSDEACERLYTALLPHQDRLVSTGPMFAGPVRDRLGLLALRLGRLDEALEHLRRCVAELDEIAALPWAARARVHLAAALRAVGESSAADRELADALEAARALGMTRLIAEIEPVRAQTTTWSLHRDGEDWVLDAGQEHARLRTSRGLEQLALLLANSGRDVPAHQLDVGEAPAESGMPVLDERAAREYQQRLARIEEEQEAADRAGDQRAATRLVEERTYLLSELRRATGLGGRRRTTGDAAERARINVTRNLKRAVDQVQRAAPIAGAHLAASIRTGLQCRYEPAAGGPAAWQVVRTG